MTTSSNAPDVIIAGGGVMGFATAYFLGSIHGMRCLVLERDAIASGASGAAAGELSALNRTEHPYPAPFISFGTESLKIHRELGAQLMEESGVNYKLTKTPIFRPAFTEEEAIISQQQVAVQQAEGLNIEWLDNTALRAARTWLPEDTLGAIYSPEDLQLETYPFAIALAQAAERYGATIRTAEVTGVQRSGQRVTGVTTATETLASDRVVLAMGPWMQYCSDWLGFRIPVEPLRGQIIHMRLPGPLPEYGIFHHTGYVFPKPSGILYVGTTEEHVGFERQTTTEARDAILEATVKFAPPIIDGALIEMTACLRPLSLDELPIIGPTPGWDGLFLATGHGRKGILMSLATGKYLAQQIAEGRADYPMEPFSPARLVK